MGTALLRCESLIFPLSYASISLHYFVPTKSLPLNHQNVLICVLFPYLCISIVSLFVSFYCVFICVFLLCLYLCLSLFVSSSIQKLSLISSPMRFLSLSLSLSLSLTHLFHFRAAFETEFLLKAQSTYIPYLLFHFLSLSLFLYSTCIIP